MNDTAPESLKRCCTCKEWKDRSEFHKCKTSADGLNPRCKGCTKIATQRWYQENRAHPRVRTANKIPFWKRNPEKNAAKGRRWRDNNREKARESSKRWLENNQEKAKEVGKRWYERNSEKVKERLARRRKENPRYAELSRERLRRRRALKRGNGGDLTLEEWKEILELYGNTCLCCGAPADKTPQGVLTQDHIVPISRGGEHSKDNIQPLCLSCNASKGTKTIDYRSN